MSSRQDKATTERNARILRELVKRPDNKACADCRKNDARWASWNLGVYLCIRCSGIHRSMGTHISKVKSIDLDMWTPEQMENIQKWGNRRANAYWERHLKAGHIPPEHKIESFIRSKYESRRWAMDGPLPRDPSVLDDLSQSQAQAGGGEASAPAPTPTQSKPATRAPTATSTSAPPRSAAAPRHPLLSRPQARAKPVPAAAPAPIIDLFGDDSPAPTPAPAATSPPTTSAQPASASTSPAATSPAQPSNMFDLDFKAPSPPPQKATTAKADIMSLFAQQPSPASASASFGGGAFFNASAPSPQTAYASWNGGITSSNPPTGQATAAPVPTWGFEQAAWGSSTSQPQTQPQQQQQQQQPHSAGFGGFNSANSSGFAGVGPSGVGGLTHTLGSLNMGGGGAATSPQKSTGLWGNDPWAAPAPAPAPAQKKDERDPFANIWS